MAGTPEPLDPDDAAILALESPAIAGHTLKLVLLEAGREPLDLERLRASVADRLRQEPRGRQRVEGAGHPGARWIEDEHFDVAAHVRRHRGTEGIDEAALWEAASELMAQRLDHRRPLWALDLVGPLADGREALVARLHHAMVDGISAVRFLDAILWDSESAPSPSPARGKPEPSTAERSRVAAALRMPGALRRELGGHTSRSPLDRTIGSARELAFTRIPLAELKRIGATLAGHVTVNDVLLAGIAGGLRSWLGADRGSSSRLRAQVPVSLHHRDHDQATLGNRDSFLNIDLPLAEPDPLARLRLINAETSKRKQLGDAEELYDLFHALGRCGPLGHALERLAGSPREFSLSVSNVPGPRTEITVAGRLVEQLHSIAEPADRHALRISAISCASEIGIGLCTDPDALPGVASLAAAIDESLAELRQAAKTA